MTLALVVSLLLADTSVLPEHPVTVSRKRAVPVLASPRSTWEQRFAALEALEKATFTDAEVKTLLAASTSLAHTPAGRCKEPRHDECEVDVGPCLSPFGYLLAAVRESNANDGFVDAALAALKPGVDPSAVAIARRVLAIAQHESIEATGLALLDGAYSCVDEAAYLLSRVRALSDGGRAGLERALTRGGENRRALGALLATRQETWARDLKLQALRSADTGLRLGSVRYANVVQADEVVLAELAHVAWCDPAARLQNEMRGRFALSKVALPDAGCVRPNVPWTVEGNTVRTRDGGVVVQLVAETGLATASDACVTWAKQWPETKPLGMLGAQCLVALNLGEWGGGLYDFPQADGGATLVVRNSFLHPRAVVQRGSELLVVSSTGRYGFGSGGVGRLSQGDGGLRYEPGLSWIGSPIAWATTKDTLFVTFPAGDFMAPCPFSKEAPEVTYRFSNDGGWSLVPGAATTCLWPD